MPAVPSWAPEVFTLTNPYSGSMFFNYDDGRGLFLLRGTDCSMDLTVRSTTDNVPQADGSILHHRFLTGTQVSLVVELWESPGEVACGAKLKEMVDLLTGSLRSLLNAGDNEGRLAWNVVATDDPLAYGPVRMLDDIRLLEYPRYIAGVAEPVFTVKIDSQYPYAQDLDQTLTSIADGATSVLNNTGTAGYDPVFKVYGPLTGGTFTLENLTTGDQFIYDEALPGAVPIGPGDYGEIDTFRNTIFLNGNSTNLKAGVLQLDSEYFGLRVGNNSIKIDGASVDVLWAPAWG